jgi:hypothetical protein
MANNVLPRLLRNAVRCNACGDEIESKQLHDHVRCKCGVAFVDGGLTYARCGFGDAGVTDLYEYSPG